MKKGDRLLFLNQIRGKGIFPEEAFLFCRGRAICSEEAFLFCRGEGYLF